MMDVELTRAVRKTDVVLEHQLSLPAAGTLAVGHMVIEINLVKDHN